MTTLPSTFPAKLGTEHLETTGSKYGDAAAFRESYKLMRAYLPMNQQFRISGGNLESYGPGERPDRSPTKSWRTAEAPLQELLRWADKVSKSSNFPLPAEGEEFTASVFFQLHGAAKAVMKREGPRMTIGAKPVLRGATDEVPVDELPVAGPDGVPPFEPPTDSDIGPGREL